MKMDLTLAMRLSAFMFRGNGIKEEDERMTHSWKSPKGKMKKIK